MNLELKKAIDQICKDRGLDRNMLIETLQEAVRTSVLRRYSEDIDVEVTYNEETGDIEVYQFKIVVPDDDVANEDTQIAISDARKHDPSVQLDDEVGFRVNIEDLGRIAAQSAKQVIIQRMRDAEQAQIFDEFKDRIGEIVSGTVQRRDKGGWVISLGRTEAILPREEQIAKERKVLQSTQKKNPGKGDRSWTDVANEMMSILDKAYKSYAGGDGAKGATLVNDAYYQYYEKLGFEKNVMNAISGDRVSQVEYQFKMCRRSMNTGASLKDTKKLVDDLKAMLVEDAGKLDGGAADKEGSFTKFITSSVGQAFLILIREGLEALLVVAAVVAYLVKSGNKRFTKWIYVGVLAGLAGAGVVAVIFVLAFGGSGPIQEIMEGVCALIAMAMLLWTSNWMLNKSSVEAWNRYIKEKTEAAVASVSSQVDAGEKVASRTVISLAMLSFLAVFREGAETVIFYQSIYTMSRDTHGMVIGAVAAAVVLLIIFFVIRFTSVKIPIGPFFLVTSILMSVLVVVFAGGGVHSLIEGDALPATYLQGVPTNDWLGFYPYVECIIAQVIAAIAVIALFVVGFIKQRKAKAKAAVTAGAPNNQPNNL